MFEQILLSRHCPWLFYLYILCCLLAIGNDSSGHILPAFLCSLLMAMHDSFSRMGAAELTRQSRGGIVQFDWSDAATARAVRWNRTQVYPSVEARSVPMRHVAYAFIGSQFAPLRNATRRAV